VRSSRLFWNALWVLPVIVFLTFFDPGWWWGFGIALLAGFANLVGYVEKAERR